MFQGAVTHHRHNETLPGELSWGRRTTGAVDGQEGRGLGERDTCDGGGVSQALAGSFCGTT